MEYYNPENRESLHWAIVAVVAYAAAITVLMLTVHFSVEQTDPADQGILVEFGQDLDGYGDEELAATDVAATPPLAHTEEPIDQLETDERQDIAIEQEPAPNKSQSKTEAPEQPTEQPDTVTKPQTVNQNALFPGRKPQSTATAQGSTQGAGNAGNESGAESGAQTGGGGDGNVEANFSLKNRSAVGALPKPSYRDQVSGKVVIDIVVDETGRVTSASYRAQGSTTNDSRLIAAARAVALKAKFTPSENFVQGGTITYTFKMN